MNCPTCGAEIVPGRKFCGGCGTALASPCAACGFANRPGVRYCEECGHALTEGPGQAVAPGVSAPAPAAVSELRLVTVLFADLVGFTTLSESRDPEAVRELLNRYFEVCRGMVERYGGVVEKFIGDAVMAVWGTPVAREDDAERAVRAALDLVDAVQQLGQEVGVPGLKARVGVLTGTAAVNLGAQGQGMVAGDLVNTASRVQSKSEPGTVLVGETTRRATEAAVAYESAGSHELKGKSEPVTLHRALRVVAGRGGLLKSERLEAPFVGRERELRLVKELFHACLEGRRAHLVQVSGLAGVGKSRLSWEFFKYMDGVEVEVYWHRGRSPAYGQGMTYFALAEMVKGRAGILEGEERTPAMAKLMAMVEEFFPEPADRRFAIPRLAHLIGLEERPAADRQDLFAAWRMFFERLAGSGPVVLVFEDMQWADPSLLEFLAYLLEWSKSLPIFVITLVRPDSDGAGLAGSLRNATSIHLDPLPRAAMEQLLTGLVPGLPPSLGERILARAEGIPLYAVETVRMLLDRGLLVEDGASYRMVGEPGPLEVPETLHALIAARLDGLSAGERKLVQDASVLGKTFNNAALAALSGEPEADLEPLLRSLVAKEILTVQADPRSPELGQYAFLQDLLRTVAYETIPRRDRRDRHLRVAEELGRAAEEGADETVEVVASHFLEAWRLDPDAAEAGELRSRARDLLVRAGERAASLAAVAEAQSAFERALELTDTAAERARLSELAGQMALRRGHVQEAAALLEEAGRLFEEAGEPRSAGRVQARLADVELEEDRQDQALSRMRRALGELEGGDPDPDLAHVLSQLGRLLALSGHREEALAALERALELAEHLALPEVYSHALSSKAILLQRADRLQEGEILLREALRVAEQHGLTEAAMRAYNNLAVVLDAGDRYTDEMELVERWLQAARRAGSRQWELRILTAQPDLLAQLGRWDEALATWEEAQQAEEFASMPGIVRMQLDLAPIHASREEWAEARRPLDTLRHMASSSNPEDVLTYAVIHAQVLLLEGRPAEACAAVTPFVASLGESGLGLTDIRIKRALALAAGAALDLGDVASAERLLGVARAARPGRVTPWLRGQVSRLSARLENLKGNQKAVEGGFRAAEQAMRDLGDVVDLGVVLTEHAEWLVAQGQLERSETLRVEAHALWEKLRATVWLQRLDRLQSGRTLTA